MSVWRLILQLVWAYLRWPWRARAYRRCLANIAALELDLGLRVADAVEEFSLAPGARWLVNDVRDVQVLPSNYVQILRPLVFKREVTKTAFFGEDGAR